MSVSPELAEVTGGPRESCPPSLFCHLEPVIASNPKEPAVIVTHQAPDHLQDLAGAHPNGTNEHLPCLTWTYTDMQRAALKVIVGLRVRSITPGSTVVTLIPNGIEWAVLFWASMLEKFTLSSLDLGALTEPRAAELRSLLCTLQPDVIVVPDADGAVAVQRALEGQSKQPSVKITLDQDSVRAPAEWTSLIDMARSPEPEGSGSVLTRASIEEAARTDDYDRTQLILFTSGTSTGKPKGCPRTVGMMLHWANQQWTSHRGSSFRSIFYTANFRAIAAIAAMRTWQEGGAIVMPGPGFSPAPVLDAIQRHKVTLLVFIPAMLHALVSHPDFDSTDKSSVQDISIGGDMITRDSYTKLCRAFPQSAVMVVHGSTEGGSAVEWPFFGQVGMQDLPFYADIAPLGKVAPGTRIRIADEHHRPVRRNEIGELHFRNNSFATRYLGGIKSEDFYQDEHGSWFKSGDTGLINDDGWIYILGRKKDIIMRAGIPITPAALESCLDSYLEGQTSVLAIPHETLGQEPFAVVRDLNGRTKADAYQQVLDLFGKDYALGGVATLEELGLTDFPLNATGKIMKLELVEPVTNYLKAQALPN